MPGVTKPQLRVTRSKHTRGRPENYYPKEDDYEDEDEFVAADDYEEDVGGNEDDDYTPNRKEDQDEEEDNPVMDRIKAYFGAMEPHTCHRCHIIRLLEDIKPLLEAAEQQYLKTKHLKTKNRRKYDKTRAEFDKARISFANFSLKFEEELVEPELHQAQCLADAKGSKTKASPFPSGTVKLEAHAVDAALSDEESSGEFRVPGEAQRPPEVQRSAKRKRGLSPNPDIGGGSLKRHCTEENSERGKEKVDFNAPSPEDGIGENYRKMTAFYRPGEEYQPGRYAPIAESWLDTSGSTQSFREFYREQCPSDDSSVASDETVVGLDEFDLIDGHDYDTELYKELLEELQGNADPAIEADPAS